MSLPELALPLMRVTGVFASTAIFNGRPAYSMFLFFIVHVVIMGTMSTGVQLGNATEATGYLIAIPIFAIGYSLLASFMMYSMRLAELFPTPRFAVREYAAPRPSLVLMFVNFLLWVLVALAPSLIYELVAPISTTGATVALVYYICAPILFWGLAWLIWAYGLPDAAMFGTKSASLNRTAGFFGGAHFVMNLIIGLVVYYQHDWSWAWGFALGVWALLALVAVVVYLAVVRGNPTWVRPPRTGYADNVPAGNIGGAKGQASVPSAAATAEAKDQDTVPLVEGGISTGRRATAAVFAQHRSGMDNLFH